MTKRLPNATPRLRREAPWTKDEDDFLRQHLALTNRQLAEDLGTTVPLVKSRLLTLKLRRAKAVLEELASEEWRPILNGVYSVSSVGRVRNNRTMREVRSQQTEEGYCRVTLRLAGSRQVTFRVHRLVGAAFSPAPEPPSDELDLTINHKNHVKNDNAAANLEWMALAENIRLAWEEGLNDGHFGEASPAANHSDATVHAVCALLQQGVPVAAVAERTGASQGHVYSVKRRETRTQISSQYKW